MGENNTKNKLFSKSKDRIKKIFTRNNFKIIFYATIKSFLRKFHDHFVKQKKEKMGQIYLDENEFVTQRTMRRKSPNCIYFGC